VNVAFTGTSAFAVTLLFTGQEHDAETEFDFFQARYLSAAQQRFLSPDPFNAGADPLNPQSWNAYAYVNNNPLNATDPTGLETWSIGGCYFNTAYAYVDGKYQGENGTVPSGTFPEEQSDGLDWTKIGSCLASSAANHYGLTALTGTELRKGTSRTERYGTK
jgi:RHS repeat-associated protein